MPMIHSFRLALLLILLCFGGHAGAQAGAERHMDVQLRSEAQSVRPGGTVALAQLMKPKPGWHGERQNPGDAGVAPRAEWQLPGGWSAGPLAYPVPSRLLVSGLMNYVYERDYALLTQLKLPASAASGATVPIQVRLDYLVCTDKLCVPESATVSTSVNVAAGAGEARTAEFDAYRQALPRPLGAKARFERKDGKLRMAIPLPAAMPVSDAYFYPITDRAAEYSAPQAVSRSGDLLIVETRAAKDEPDPIAGVLAIGEGQGLVVNASPGPVPAAGQALEGAAGSKAGGVTFLAALAGALVGGLLLNIMPCVFPILSLKALSLARAGETASGARSEGLAYAAGAVLVCLGLGALILVLRAGGETIGWAFQLQDPRVILFLLLLVIALTLNLAGLFELPTLGFGNRLASQGGIAGAFWTGGLAAFVATPCTGPFMGAALGAALILPPAAALAVFGGLGFGLALPFLLLGFIPALRRRLPRPGAWMVRFKQVLAIPMALTALWLGWLLERLTGTPGIAVGLVAALIVGIALWWAGRRAGWAPIAPALLAAGIGILALPTAAPPAEAATGGRLHAEPFSEAKLAALRAERRPVFVYFTADWCLTCKVNEKAVLEREEVAKAFAAGKVSVLVGDWTRGDAAIGRFLERQGRSGVPLYLYYAPGKEAAVLPQILTTGQLTALVK
jgi:DsbC/DsbD-like thiol-disulfide interchange protein/cytochrome c biogenesis protein CcdA